MLGCDLAEALLVPGDQGRTDAAATKLRVDGADLKVDARTVGFLTPLDAAVSDGASVDLGDEEVPCEIAALEMLVHCREPLGGRDAVTALAFSAGREDASDL